MTRVHAKKKKEKKKKTKIYLNNFLTKSYKSSRRGEKIHMVYDKEHGIF